MLWETNPELAREKQEAEERKRIKLRMTQKHRQTSAWMKKTLKRGGGATKGSKEAVLEQLQEREKLHRAIMNRPEQQQDDEEEEEDENMTDVDRVKSLMTEIQSDSDAMKKKDKGLFGMKFMQNSMEKQRLAALENAKALLRDLEGTATKKKEEKNVDGKKHFGKNSKVCLTSFVFGVLHTHTHTHIRSTHTDIEENIITYKGGERTSRESYARITNAGKQDNKASKSI